MQFATHSKISRFQIQYSSTSRFSFTRASILFSHPNILTIRSTFIAENSVRKQSKRIRGLRRTLTDRPNARIGRFDARLLDDP
jgi:hypothetical protein